MSAKGKLIKVSDLKTWICIYPAYIDKKRSESNGRKVNKTLAVEDPNVIEINDSCKHLKFDSVIEDKRYPADFFTRGRVRVKLKKADGTPVNESIATRKALLLEVCKLVPKHKLRQKVEEQKLALKAQSSKGGKGSGKNKKKGKKK